MRHFHRWLFLGATAVASSCARESGKPSTALTVDTTGTVVWFRHSAPTAMDTLQPVLTIGPGDEAHTGADSSFARITSIALREDGGVFVADGQKFVVNLYASSGQRITSFGRSGQGPGEFRALYSLAFLGDTLLALDGPNARMSLFTSAGQFLSTWPWHRLTGSPTTVRFFETGPREVHVLGLGRRSGERGPTFIHLGPLGPADTVSFAQTSAQTSSMLICPRPDQGITFFSTPFTKRPIAVPAPNGLLATASTDQYEIVLRNRMGDTVHVITREYRHLPVNDDEWSAATAEYEEFKRAWPAVKCEPNTMTRPSHHAAILGIYFDREGRMIVEVTADKVVRYDIYAADGTSVGAYILPLRDDGVTPYFRGNRIAQVAKDSLDVQSVQVFTRH